MTTWKDYSVDPPANNSAPPVGAPEFMPTTQVNNVQREMMSVIRQMGDEFDAKVAGLGTMATQNADAVNITGGTITGTHVGPGAGLTNLKAQALIEGPIPAAIFPADSTPLNVKVARAGAADSLTTWNLPIGSIVLWYSANPIPSGWRICDGGGGTPNLVGRFAMGAGSGVALGQQGGQYSYNAVSDAQGNHSHGGGTAGAELTVAQLPPHSHAENWFDAGGAGPYFNGPLPSGKNGNIYQNGIPTGDAGSGQAHAHGIGADGNHAHNVSVNSTPPYTAVFYIMRVS